MNHDKPAFWTHAVRHGLYPLLLLTTLAYLAWELGGPRAALGSHYGAFVAALVVVMVLIESAHALRADWRMNWRLFSRRDGPFLLIGAATLGAINWSATQVVTSHALRPGLLLADLPLLPGVLLCLLITDGLWYALHRYCHEGRGALGRWCWRMHSAHHGPQQVYVLMHAIGHPINALLVRALLTVPPFVLGFSAEVVFAASVITGLQGLVSHFNVDSRAGWLNHLLVGTELHRYHHSAEPAEARNYGAVLSVWDQLFGSFVYRPGQAPRALGLKPPQDAPGDEEILQVLLYPLR